MLVSRVMNRLRGSLSSNRIVDLIRISLPDSYQQSLISTTVKSRPLNLAELRCFSSSGFGRGGDGDVAGETTIPDSPHEPQPDRPPRGGGWGPPPLSPRRKSRFESPARDDYSFLEKFKLGVDNERAGNPRREEANPPSPSPPENADEIFRTMKEKGLIPNAVAMLDGLCQDGLVQEAMKLFGLMREKGTIPEVVVYTAVVDGFCKAHKLDDAVRIFRKMQSNGIAPNAFSYRVLVQGLCKCERSDEGLEFCLEMLEAGHSPNVETFVGLINGTCEAKGVEEAQAVYGRLREKGFVLNEKAAREFLEKKAPFSPAVWEAIFGTKKSHQRLF